MAEPYTKLSRAPPEVVDPEAPERVQIFVARYRYFFLLLAVLVAQLLLLSVQITRSQGTLLIQAQCRLGLGIPPFRPPLPGPPAADELSGVRTWPRNPPAMLFPTS